MSMHNELIADHSDAGNRSLIEKLESLRCTKEGCRPIAHEVCNETVDKAIAIVKEHSVCSEICLPFSIQKLQVIYNHIEMEDDLQENLFRAIKHLKSTEPVSVGHVKETPESLQVQETCKETEQPVELLDETIIKMVDIFNNPKAPKIRCEECDGKGQAGTDTEGYPYYCYDCEGAGYIQYAVNQAERLKQAREIANITTPKREYGGRDSDGEAALRAYHRFRSEGKPHALAQELANNPENWRRGTENG